jgi:hypothetical protein
MAAILALVLHSILQADSGQGQPPASAPAATAPAPSGPAATTKPSELSLCVAAIGAAPDAVSAAEAYSRGCKIDRSCPALHEAYMRRALQLGNPEAATYGARALLAVQPANPLARSVMAYSEGKGIRLADALNDTMAIVAQLKDDDAVMNNAGQLVGWHELFAQSTKIPDAAQKAIDKLRDDLFANAAFSDAYARVKADAAKEQARKDDLNSKIAGTQDEIDKLDLKIKAYIAAQRQHDNDVASAQATYDDALARYNNWSFYSGFPNASLKVAVDNARRALDAAKAAPLNCDGPPLDVLNTTRTAKLNALNNLKVQLAIVVMPAFRWETPAVDGVPTPKGHGQPDAATATSRPAASQPSPLDHETLAARQLNLAQNYVSANMKAKAVKLLNALLEDYPQTKAAKEARQLLDQLSGQ